MYVIAKGIAGVPPKPTVLPPPYTQGVEGATGPDPQQPRDCQTLPGIKACAWNSPGHHLTSIQLKLYRQIRGKAKREKEQRKKKKKKKKKRISCFRYTSHCLGQKWERDRGKTKR